MVKQEGTKTARPLGPKLLHRNAVHLLAFGFVAGRMKCSNVTFQSAVSDFVDHFGLKGVNEESLEREVRRVILEYMSEGL